MTYLAVLLFWILIKLKLHRRKKMEEARIKNELDERMELARKETSIHSSIT